MKTILLGVLVTLASVVHANERCNIVADLAETTMEIRQAGHPLSEVLEVMGDEPFYMAMAVQAYKQPLWRVEENKAEAIAEYRNEWHLACLEL